MVKQGQIHTILGAHDNVIVWFAENFYLAFINTIQKGVLVGLVTIELDARKNYFIGGWKSSNGGSKVMLTSCSRKEQGEPFVVLSQSFLPFENTLRIFPDLLG